MNSYMLIDNLITVIMIQFRTYLVMLCENFVKISDFHHFCRIFAPFLEIRQSVNYPPGPRFGGPGRGLEYYSGAGRVVRETAHPIHL